MFPRHLSPSTLVAHLTLPARSADGAARDGLSSTFPGTRASSQELGLERTALCCSKQIDLVTAAFLTCLSHYRFPLLSLPVLTNQFFFFREGCCFPQDLLHHRAVCHLQKSLKWDNKAIKVRRVRNTTTGTWFLQAAPLFTTFSCPQAAVLKLTLMLRGCRPMGRCFTFTASHHEDVPPAFSEFRDVIRKNGVKS